MNSNYEREYKNLIKDILINGQEEPVRNNNVAKSLFGQSLSFSNQNKLFPMLTSKRMYFKNIVYELKWILDGQTNVNYLKNNGVSIWNKWADDNGEIGDTYGKQLRSFNGVDQLLTVIDELVKFKHSRQLVISLWNPVAITQGNLRPCYHAFQLVYIGGKLNIIVSQRSADVFVGLPYDIAVFSLLLSLICNTYDMVPGVVKINIGNAHIYKEHYNACMTYLNNPEYDLPGLQNYETGLLSFVPYEIVLKHYISEDFIRAKIII